MVLIEAARRRFSQQPLEIQNSRPRSSAAPLQTLEEAGLGNYYWIYFQKPGVAEAEFERDPAVTLRKLLYGMDEMEATEFLLDRLRGAKTNGEFFESMKRN